MSGPKPTLGYPTRTAAAQALHAAGMSYKSIADRLGISTSAASGLLASGKRKKRLDERTVVFPVVVLKQLSQHAGRRGISVNELVRRIVETVADEGMVDAVLDDTEDAA